MHSTPADSDGPHAPGGIWRAVDAAANRGLEALRVLEDVLRFSVGDRHLTDLAKSLRHDLAATLAGTGLHRRIMARDVPGDVGVGLDPPRALTRRGAADVLAANAARAAQALRSLQETAAVVAPATVGGFESLRYRLYTLERAAALVSRSQDRLAGITLCVLVDGAADAGTFARLVDTLATAGVRMFQLRDKSLPIPVLVDRARAGLKICRRRPAGERPLFVVNDRVDVAAAVAADGGHVGADDLPVPLARRVLGPDPLVGRTAHDVAEARQAVLDGADYLGIGPCFPSATKSFAAQATPEFLRTVCGETSLPTFAIGGITAEKLPLLIDVGVTRIAVASAVTRAADPPRAARELIDTLARLTPQRPAAASAP